MKKLLFLSALIASSLSFAQEVSEPEFIGETILLNTDNTTTSLEKQLTQNRTVAIRIIGIHLKIVK